MKQENLTAILRNELTKGQLKEFKSKGYVPGVIYGENIKENINIFCFINDLKKLIYTSDEYQVNLKVEGKIYPCVIKEIQFDPVSDLPIHIDFMQVYDEKVIKIDYPVKFVGTPKGAMQGGKVYRKLRKLTLKGKVKDLPETLEIDITHLDIGQSLKIKDINIPNIEILMNPNTPVVTISRPRVSTATAVTEETTEEQAAESQEEQTEATE